VIIICNYFALLLVFLLPKIILVGEIILSNTMINVLIKAILVIILPIYAIADDAAPIKSKEEVLKIKKDEFIIGDKKARITIIEYSSLACPHCATYHMRVFPEIKKNYIDKGKVKYIFRDFPTNHPATLASLLVHCSGDRKLNFMDALFESQKVWAFNMEYKEKLHNIAKLGGISDEVYNTCINDNDKINIMLGTAYDAVKALNIDATPVFFINGQRFENSLSFKKFAEAIDIELAKKK
jgi:protein-disulfide isomerase